MIMIEIIINAGNCCNPGIIEMQQHDASVIARIV